MKKLIMAAVATTMLVSCGEKELKLQDNNIVIVLMLISVLPQHYTVETVRRQHIFIVDVKMDGAA